MIVAVKVGGADGLGITLVTGLDVGVIVAVGVGDADTVGVVGAGVAGTCTPSKAN